jgi:hypothetical protein
MWATRMREAGDDIMRQRAECWCMALAYAASVVKVALVDGFLPNPHTEESK